MKNVDALAFAWPVHHQLRHVFHFSSNCAMESLVRLFYLPWKPLSAGSSNLLPHSLAAQICIPPQFDLHNCRLCSRLLLLHSRFLLRSRSPFHTSALFQRATAEYSVNVMLEHVGCGERNCEAGLRGAMASVFAWQLCAMAIFIAGCSFHTRIVSASE